jgi:hypothetical protein
MDADKVKMDYKNLKKRYESMYPETIQEILETLYDVFLLKWMEKKLEGRIENVPPYTIDFPKMWKDMEKKPQWDVYLRCTDYMKHGVSEKMAEEYHARKKIEFPESESHFAPHVSDFFAKTLGSSLTSKNSPGAYQKRFDRREKKPKSFEKIHQHFEWGP